MLMQIAEPGETKTKEACKQRVVGIDLGTTNSLVAHVGDGSPQVLGDDPIVPSVVAYGDRVLVGREAEAAEAPVSSRRYARCCRTSSKATIAPSG